MQLWVGGAVGWQGGWSCEVLWMATVEWVGGWMGCRSFLAGGDRCG